MLTGALLHAIFNSLLTPTTAYESQATACGVAISLDMQWIGVNCIFMENIFFVLINIFFKLKNILSQFL